MHYLPDVNICPAVPTSVALEGRVQELERELREARALHKRALEACNKKLNEGTLECSVFLLVCSVYHMTEVFSL